MRRGGRTSCTLPTQYCLPVPWYVVPTGKSSNVPWTRCHALEPELIEPRSPGDACNVRVGGGTAFRRSAAGMDTLTPQDGEPENPWGLSPRGGSASPPGNLLAHGFDPQRG